MGKTQYALISAPSNTVIQTRPGVLHSVLFGVNTAGSTVRIDDTHRFAAGTVSASATSSNTVGLFTGTATGLNIGLNTGLVVAVSSNSVGLSSITIEYE